MAPLQFHRNRHNRFSFHGCYRFIFHRYSNSVYDLKGTADMAYQPGTALPFVETHIMEHGLLMLAGSGIYRLDADWYPVQAGYVIWMAPYCPQWFAAIGDAPASYILL